MSNVSNPPRRHHYIPQFYLRQWTGPDGQLERYTKPIPSKLEIKRVSTKAVGWWLDLYRAPEGHPDKDQYLERFVLRELDNRAAVVLRKWNESPVPQLSIEELSTWTTFLMSLMHRTPEGLEAYKETGRKVWEQTLPDIRSAYPELRGPDDPETVEEYEASLTVEDADRSLLRNFAKTISNPKIGTFLNGLYWTSFDRPEGAPDYLLSDDPLVRTNGLKQPNGHLAIPVSPTRVVIGAYRRAFLNEVAALKGKELVRQMNTFIVEGARHFVVSGNLQQTRFIANRFGAKPRPGLAREMHLS